MKVISLKNDENTLYEANGIGSKINLSRNEYVNNAIAHYNKVQSRKVIEKALKEESKLVRRNSMKVLLQLERTE